MRQRNVGDLQTISIGNICLEGVINKITVVDTDGAKGIIEEYTLDQYGDTQGFWYPDKEIWDEQTQRRKSRSMMPLEYVYKRARDIDWKIYGQDIAAQQKIANAFVINFSEFQRQGRGLYIVSRAKGSGKTMLACCIANEIMERRDLSVKFITVPEYIELIKSKEESDKDTIKAILDCSLLILDDIGAETHKQDWVTNALFRLVDYRDKNMLPTIYTSNCEIDELSGDERMISRIEGHSVPLIMPEVSVRRMKAKEKTANFLKSVLGNDGEDVFSKK